MIISNAVTNAHVFSEKFIYSSNIQKEINLNNEIKRVWSIDKETIQHGFRNGPAATQHGVNAEYQHIADFNIKEIRQAALEGREAVLMTKSPELNGPADMVRGDQIFQAKYYNNPKGSLDACIDHLEKYEEKFGAGTNSTYVIPSEHHSTLLAIKQGQVPEGVTARQAEGIRASIEQFEAKKGPIEDCIQPGSTTYSEAQIENVDKCIEQKEVEIEETHKAKKAEIEAAAAPSFSKMFKQAGISALIAGMFSVYCRISKDKKDGKNVFAGEYKKEDFFTLAKEFLGSGALAGINSGIVYGIYAKFGKSSRPVVATYGIAKSLFVLTTNYKEGKITIDELYEQSCVNIAVIILDSLGNSIALPLLEKVLKMMGAGSFVSLGASMIVSLVVSYLVMMMVGYIKDNYGDKIKETVLNFVDFLDKIYTSQKVKVTACKEEVGKSVKALTANISSRFGTFKCSPSC